MRKRKLQPDTRLDWRDPNMPVLRKGYYHNKIVVFEVDPAKVHKYYIDKMNDPNYVAPQWKDDPTYFLNKRK